MRPKPLRALDIFLINMRKNVSLESSMKCLWDFTVFTSTPLRGKTPKRAIFGENAF